MIKMFVMHTCPDCEYVERQVEGNPNFEVIDIGKHVRNLKKFLDLRDSHPAFDEAKAIGDVGIPCYVLEDGTVTLYSKDVGLEPRERLLTPPMLRRHILSRVHEGNPLHDRPLDTSRGRWTRSTALQRRRWVRSR